MPLLVFSQVALEPSGLLRAATLVSRSLPSPLDVDVAGFEDNAHLGSGIGSEAAIISARLSVDVRFGELEGRFALQQRANHETALSLAQAAEQRGQAHGMAQLAQRCPWVWELDSEEPLESALAWLFCAALASWGLGPILPSDHSTLFGVRGARLRAGV
ncbi:MAG: hypothetical protein H6718_08605 [Polyangiaceae bacterium]|nr:hypothetical protein [Myxococcales bacterium]MCB9585444.1 hypothetical protein [Polyangiaceae bacterium]MCB9606540.1 hypothetical protein [Polyangiaceae bacterium]